MTENGRPGELTVGDVHDLLTLFEQSDYEHLEVQIGQTRLVASKSSATAPAVSSPTGPNAAPDAPAPVASARSAEPSPAAPAPAVEAQADLEALTSQEDVTIVAAPVVGTFYRASEPGAEPYTDVGKVVAEGQTLGLVELMKMFNGVQAPCAGEVVAVFASDAEFVEYGQPLIALRKADA